MNATSEQVLKSALALPESDRAEIATLLIRSLDGETDEDVDAAWAVEIQNRIDSIENGSAKLIPWDEVMRDMRSGRNG